MSILDRISSYLSFSGAEPPVAFSPLYHGDRGLARGFCSFGSIRRHVTRAKRIEIEKTPFSGARKDGHTMKRDAWIGKEVIDTGRGRRIGFVTETERDREDRRLLSLWVPTPEGRLRIPWTCIEFVGEDFVIVRMRGEGSGCFFDRF